MSQNARCNLVCSYTKCNKTFSKPSRLKHHFMTHTGDRPYMCDVDDCDKSYTRSAHLKRHTEVVHERETSPSESLPLRCAHDGCDSSFASTDSLKKHWRQFHEGSLPYKCEEPDCGEAFRKKHQLKSHTYVHEGVLPFQCTEAGCDKKFAQKNRLERHKKVHQGYPCTKNGCSEIFSKFSQLCHHHKLCHKEEHVCPECGKRFRSSSWLTQHRQTHQDARTVYQCPRDSCTRRYLDLRNLTAHVRSFHDRDRFQCTQAGCGSSFATKPVIKKTPKATSKPDILKDLTGISKKALESATTSCIDMLAPRIDSPMNITSSVDSPMNITSSESPPVSSVVDSMDCDPVVAGTEARRECISDIQCARFRQLYGHQAEKCTSSQSSTHEAMHSRT